MSISYELQNSIEQVYAQMMQTPKYTLLPKYRFSLYKLIASLDAPIDIKLYGWLDMFTAKRVSPIWEQALPGDNFVFRMLDVAEGLLTGKLSYKETEEERNFFYYASGSEMYNENISNRPRAAKEAAYIALKTVCGVVPFGNFDIEQIERGFPDEIIIELGETDVAAPAVLAYSGFDTDFDYDEGEGDNNNFIDSNPNMNVSSKFDPDKRREFWEWWLKEAIPQAWELAQQSSST